MMKRLRHEGARLAGVEHPDSLADHTTRAALMAYLLAVEEKADPLRCAMMVLIHDIPECRVGDQHKVAARYFDVHAAEQRAFTDQSKNLPATARGEWQKMFDEFNSRSSQEGKVAKDADWLEMAVSAQEYVARGYAAMEDWLQNIAKALETKTAQKWLRQIQKTSPTNWWRGLKKMTYTKLT